MSIEEEVELRSEVKAGASLVAKLTDKLNDSESRVAVLEGLIDQCRIHIGHHANEGAIELLRSMRAALAPAPLTEGE